MRKLFFLLAILIFIFVKTEAQSNFIQFSQAPVNLNPALAGAADQLRLTAAGNTFLTESTSTSNSAFKYKVQVNQLNFSADQFIRKLSSGIGFYCMVSRQLFTDRAIPKTGTVINITEEAHISFGLSIAPKFTLKKGFKRTISPSIELNSRYYNAIVNAENATGMVISQNITNWQIGYRLGLSIVYNKSVFGFVIGNNYFASQPSLQMPYTYSEGYYVISGVSMPSYIYNSKAVDSSRTVKPYKNLENFISYSTHYGYTFTSTKPKDITLTLQAYISWTFNRYFDNSRANELDNGGYNYDMNTTIMGANFRYQKLLTGLSLSTMADTRIIGSIGYQSQHLKTIISTDFKKIGEVTCSYVF